MIFFKLLADFKELLKQGSALKNSGFLINVEATSVALYGLFNALVIALNDLGFNVHIGATDLHTMANGWAITASFGYSIYRVVTNTHAGFKRLQPENDIKNF